MKTGLFLSILIFVFSCDRLNLNESKETNIFYKLEPKCQVFRITPKRDTSVQTKNGIVIEFKKGIFQNLSGVDYNGEVCLYIKEFFSPSDIIFSRLATVSGNKLLQTGGMINVTAVDSIGVEITLKKSNFFGIMFPKASSPDSIMSLYKGNPDTNAVVDWVLVKDSPVRNISVELNDSILTESQKNQYLKSIDYFIFNTKSFGWLNCDKELENVSNTNLTVKTNQKKTTFRLIFPKMKSVAYSLEENGLYRFYNIPNNEKAILIGYSVELERYFFSYTEITIEKGQVIEQNLYETSLDSIKLKVNSIQWSENAMF